jgi:adenylate cyclase
VGRRRKRTKIALFLGMGVLTTALALAAYAGHLVNSLELRSVDQRFALRSSPPKPKDVVVVAIDAKTFTDFSGATGPLHDARSHIASQWPFPRRYDARVIREIAAGHPKAIGVDIQFTERTPGKKGFYDDNALIWSVILAKNVVLSATEVDQHGRTDVLGGINKVPLPGNYHVISGSTLFGTDSDGVIRRMANSIEGLTTFAVATAAIAQGKPVPRPAAGSNWIDFTGPPGTVRTYSFSSVYFGLVPPKAFADKVVVIGPSAPSLQDVHPTSASGSELMPGAEVQANAIETALRGFKLQSTPIWLNALLIVLLGMLPAVLSLRLSAVKVALISIGAGLLFAVAVQLAFDADRVVLFTYPLLALIVSAIGVIIIQYVLEAFERALTRDVFARFVPEAVVDQVLARTGGELRLGGEKVFGTAMFTDLRGFTTFSEGMAADEVIGLLNRYLGIMSDVVLAHGGTLVTYTGDGMMAVFGAPLPQADHADRALAAAREMIEVRLPAFNDWLHEETGREYSFKMGVGLNSGDFMSGNVGSQHRLEYTAIGDTINTCSRIEGLTKGKPYALFMAGSTRDALLDPPADLLYIDEMPIRGRAHTIPIWSLSSDKILKSDWESEGKSPSPAEHHDEPAEAPEPVGTPAPAV